MLLAKHKIAQDFDMDININKHVISKVECKMCLSGIT